MSKPNLIDTIQRLRALASAAYDKAVFSGMSNQEAAQIIAPFGKMMSDSIASSVETDLPGCAEAIRVLEELSLANRRVAQKYIEKAQDEANHALTIKRAIREMVFTAGTDRVIEEDGTIITVPDQGDPSSLSIR